MMGEQHCAALRGVVAEATGTGEQAEAVEEHREIGMQQHGASGMHRAWAGLRGFGRLGCRCAGRSRCGDGSGRQRGHGDAIVQRHIQADHLAQLRHSQSASERAEQLAQRGDLRFRQRTQRSRWRRRILAKGRRQRQRQFLRQQRA
ncbi:hypothetical protein D9M70_552280 [compost metagenome]